MIFGGLILAILACIPISSGLKAQIKEKPKKGKTTTPNKNLVSKNKAKIDYLFIEACTQHIQGNLPEAIGLFKEVVQLDGSNHAALYNIGRIYAQLKDYENARRYCETALGLDPDNLWYYNELVNAYQNSHLPAKALATQEALVKKFPTDKNGLYDLAQMYISEKRFQDALDIYTKLEALTGLNEEISFRKHQLFMFVNQPEKALSELEKLVRGFPGEPRYVQAQYDILSMMGKEAEAMSVLEKLLEANPNDAFALISLADYYKSKGDSKKSDEYLFKAFRSKDVDLNVKAKIISGLYQMAEKDPAILPRVKALASLLQEAHPNSALAAGIRGDIFQGDGLLDSAQTCYRQSLRLDPTNENVWEELLFVDADLGDNKSLKKDAEKALEYFPNQVAFLYFYGVGSERTGDFDEAVYAFEKLRKIPSAEKEMTLQALISLGTVYHKTEKFAKSNEALEAALELSPGNPLVLNNYAYYLSLRNERMDDAERMAKQALDKQPNSSAVQDTYGWILFLKGNLNEAEHWIKRAAENDGGADIWEHLGDVYKAKGDMSKAEEAWKKAMEKGASFTLSDKQK